MKVEVKDNEKQQEEINYPCLRKSISTGLIVFFTDKKKGIVINGDEHQQTGHYSSIWDMSMFEEFTGSITLSSD